VAVGLVVGTALGVGARVAVGGAGPAVARLSAAEEALLRGDPVADLAAAAIAASDDEIAPLADVRGSSDWKRRVVRQTVREAMADAVRGGSAR
jgi:carbon-monoxide dehydrogenase medium subunit